MISKVIAVHCGVSARNYHEETRVHQITFDRTVSIIELPVDLGRLIEKVAAARKQDIEGVVLDALSALLRAEPIEDGDLRESDRVAVTNEPGGDA